MLKLSEELIKHPGDTVYLGTRTSFFFVGPSEEAIRDIVLVDRMERAYADYIGRKIGFAKIAKSDMPKECIGERNVTDVYKRDSGVEHEVVIIVEGREFGAFWTRNEYLKGRDAFRRALNRACAVSSGS